MTEMANFCVVSLLTHSGIKSIYPTQGHQDSDVSELGLTCYQQNICTFEVIGSHESITLSRNLELICY